MNRLRISAALIIITVLAVGLWQDRLGRDTENLEKTQLFQDNSAVIIPPFLHLDNSYMHRNDVDLVFSRLYVQAPGIAVADFNQDNLQDFVTVDSAGDALPQIYINQNGESFLEQATKYIEAAQDLKFSFRETQIAPFIFDYDNNGWPDLLITTIGCSRFFLNISGKLHYQAQHKLSTACIPDYAALPYDFNQDGKIDLYLNRFYPKRWASNFDKITIGEQRTRFLFSPTKLHNNFGSSQNLLWLNGKRNSFVSENIAAATFSRDALISDLNEDGQDELIIANSFNRQLIYNYAPEEIKFYNNTNRFITSLQRFGHSLNINYLPNNSKPFLFISNVKVPLEQGTMKFQADAYYYNYVERDEIMQNLAKDYGLTNCGYSLGAVFADFNLDGFNDNYVASGFLSSKTLNQNGQPHSHLKLPVANYQAQLKENYIAATAQDIFLAAWSETSDHAFGRSKDCLNIYDGFAGKFNPYQITDALDPAYDSRAVATIDYDNDGDLDLLVTAQNNYLRLLKNNKQQQQQSDNWIGFKVANQQFLRKITLIQNNVFYYKDWQAGRSGFLASSDPRIHFGLPSDNPVEVIFRFQDGRLVTKSFLPGQYYDLAEL